jgi:hypothetical protein
MVGLTFDGQEKTLAEHWPILTSADVLEPLQSGCVLDKCAGRGFVERVKAGHLLAGGPPPSTAQRARRSRALHRIRRQGRTGGIALLGPRGRTTSSKVDPMRRASPTTNNAEGILHRGRASHAKHPFHGSRFPALPPRTMAQALPRRASSCESGGPAKRSIARSIPTGPTTAAVRYAVG